MPSKIPVSEWKEHLCGRVIIDVDVKESTLFSKGSVTLTLYEPKTDKTFLFEISRG